jgi:hypothetical protein
MQLRRHTRQESGQATLTIVMVLIGVIAVSVLLVFTMSAAVSINKKATNIEDNVKIINVSGDSIPALVKTNEIADSILVTAAPLEEQVRTIEGLAINIDKNALSIDQTAATIVQTALGINAEAVDILNTARSIDVGAKTITRQLVDTVNVARNIKADTGSIIIEATSIHRNACGLALGILGLGQNCAAINPTGHN